MISGAAVPGAMCRVLGAGCARPRLTCGKDIASDSAWLLADIRNL